MHRAKKRTLLLLAAITLGVGAAFSPSGAPNVARAAIPLRGVVEGFYGTPWTTEKRLDMFSFMANHGLNAYIYAPKDDPYHREKWREPYPPDEMSRLKTLIETANKHNVRFVFAVSPGLDIRYTGEAGQSDREFMRQKFVALYEAGVRDFAVFFDDIKDRDGKNQARLVAWLTDNFVKQYPGVSPLITVPTEYFLRDMKDEFGQTKPYTRDFAANLPAEALPLFTGEEVVAPQLTEGDITEVNGIYGKKVGVWHNYPVTDYMEEKLALGAVINLPKDSDNIAAIFFNPMKHAELSKIALATGSDYARDSRAYAPSQARKKAVASLVAQICEPNDKRRKDFENALLIFAEHSQKLKNSWADSGHEDGRTMNAHMEEFLSLYDKKNSAAKKEFPLKMFALQHEAKDLVNAAVFLQKNLPAHILAECEPQLQQLERIGQADLTALRILSLKRGNKDASKPIQKLAAQTAQIKEHEAHAKISELPAREKLYALALKQ